MSAQTRRQFVRQAGTSIVAAGAAAALQRGAAAGEPRRKPNVLFAFSDEHRYQSMSVSGMRGLQTPNMAKLAAEGVTFTNCVSNYPVCSPYRAMLMTGRWPYNQRMKDDSPGMIDNSLPLSPEQPTLGKVFREAGYATGYVGKWHLGGTRAEAFGFDMSLIWTNDNLHWDKSKYHPKDGAPIQPKGYNATLMTDQALAFLEGNKDKPFFLMLSWNPPHSNFTDAPEEMKALYPAGSLEYRPNVPQPGEDAKLGGASWKTYQGYHGHVSAIDRELGRLMAKLTELGVAGDTILVYSSDHGSMLGSHGVGGKRQPYEESIKTPLIVRYPRAAPARGKIASLFGTIDKFPTLCGLAGIPIPKECDGLDFAESVRGGKGPEPESQFLMHLSKQHASGGEKHPAPLFRGVTTGRHTYAVYPDRPWCLFDNEADPYQGKNLLDDPGKESVRKQCRALLAEWLRKAGDPFRMPV